jgi:phosphonoacetate hydrolase
MKSQRCLIIMMDGFGMDYYRRSDMPALKSMAAGGFFAEGRAVYPTLTNANNVSIVCGAWPERHGITTNCYFDEAAGTARFLEDPSFLSSPTIFEKARERGTGSALLTSKAKTLGILGRAADIGVAAQGADPRAVRRYGSPPDIYSAEVNEWLFRAAIDILEHRPEIGVIYLHTTDYPMHRWAPDERGSLSHLAAMDHLIGEAAAAASDAAVLLTADHGMNPKKRCLDLSCICAAAGVPLRFAISPVADLLLEHHRGHGGVSYLYVKDLSAREQIVEFLGSVPGVEEALLREEAAPRYHLMADRIGDIVVGADGDTVFGTLPAESEELPPDYRNHGSHHEAEIPLLAWNLREGFPRWKEAQMNFDLTRLVFFESLDPGSPPA